MNKMNRNDCKNRKIIIIGSGASGIAAATKLIEHGFQNVTVLEAENRIGGRVHTIPFGQNVVDLGAQWCHGEEGNVVCEIARKYQSDIFGSREKGAYENIICVKSNKEVLPRDVAQRLNELIENCLESEEALSERVTFEGSLGKFLDKRLNEALEKPENADLDKKLVTQFRDFYMKFECSLDACDSAYDLAADFGYLECKGDQLLNWRGRGYVTILRILMKSTEDKPYGVLENKILLNKEVEEICWKQEGKVCVRCTDGEKLYADHIICTVSLGVLKAKHSTLFNPSLPPPKTRAIEGLGFGNVDKLFIEFAKPFWPEDWTGSSLLWEGDDLEEIRKREDNWIEDVFGFYPVDNQPNIICGWIVGANGRKMEAATSEEVLSGVMFLLRKFLTFEIPHPSNFIRTTWYKNANFRGSYSFRSMETVKMNTNPGDLAEPLKNDAGDPVLQFAGEATHDHYFSTVHGAVETGWREAERIQNLCTVKNDLNSSENTNVYDVIVLGGGLAGLAAGYRLQQHNNLSNSEQIKFLILEAQNYIGGRVRTVQMKSTHNESPSSFNDNISDIVDSGAQWLHGEHNRLYKIAKDSDLLTSVLSEEGLGSYLCENGETIDEFFCKKIDFKIGQILGECEKFIEENYEKNHTQKSVGEYLDEKFSEYLQEQKTEILNDPKKYEITLKLYDWHKRFQIIDNSCLNLKELSSKFWGMYSYNGESCQAHINFKMGFSTVIYDALLKCITKENIRVNSKVCDINWNFCDKKGNQIRQNDHQNLICIETSDKRLYYAKHVIITFSLGVLKFNMHKLFTPNLPKRICDAILSIGYEAINKIFLQFEEPWWLPMEGIQFLFDDNDYQNSNWTRYLTGFDILYPGSPNTLVGWIGSSGAIEMEKLTDDELIRDCIDLLAKFTKRKVPNPIRFYCSRWHSNEFIRGGYSFLSTKCEQLNVTGRSLADPITLRDLKSSTAKNGVEHIEDLGNLTFTNGNSSENEEVSELNTDPSLDYPLMLFAGEACHDKYFSTAHGAFESGYEQAQKLLQFYSVYQQKK